MKYIVILGDGMADYAVKEFDGKTILFVTHRNTSLKVCDKIIHVENKDFKVIKE